MPLPAEDITDLVRAARCDEPGAWDALLKRHQLPLYSYAAELTRDPAMSFDIVQETFVAAVKHLGSLREDAKFTSWLFGISHQKCVQHFRRSKRRDDVFVDGPGELDDSIDDGMTDPRRRLMGAEEAAEFFSLVDQLPVAQRSALLLHVIEDFSMEEIAEIAAVPVGTIKSRLHHAKRALRKLVEEKV